MIECWLFRDEGSENCFENERWPKIQKTYRGSTRLNLSFTEVVGEDLWLSR